MTAPSKSLQEFCERSLAREVPRELHAMADFLRQKYGDAAAILAYGSCLRGVAVSDTLMDFYVLTENLGAVSSNVISRLSCAIVPPNVYYAETEFEKQRLRAKYAVLPLPHFAKWMSRDTSNPYFWVPCP